MSIVYYSTAGLFILISVLLLAFVLVQSGKGTTPSIFGGSSGNSVFGPKTVSVLTWATSVLFGGFIVLAIVLNLMMNRH